MTHLLQVALGPVQGFIATARRSRDLWFGSYILSELSKSAALSLQRNGVTLIFPAPALSADLEPDTELLVANIVTGQADGMDLAAARAALDSCREDVALRWRVLCDKALAEIAPRLHSRDRSRRLALIRDDVWRAQLDDVVEFFCAAVPLSQGYRAANDRLRDLMGRRKNTRWFDPYLDDSRLPKSSLDGSRSTVLMEARPGDVADVRLARLRIGIEPAEQLDTAGTVKRVVGRQRGFLPVARVAAAHWIERAAHEKPALLAALIPAFDGLVPDGLATRLQGKYAEYGWVANFPFDAQLLYPERIDAEEGKLQRTFNLNRRNWQLDSLGKSVQQLRSALGPLLDEKALGRPQPYYAMLLADGDHMGGLIDRAASAADGARAHRDVSRALSNFAQGVPDLMATAGGACIYSGGDDVLGLVPLHRLLACADGLRADFAHKMGPVAAAVGLPAADYPTLSVGIAIVHMLEPLGDVRELAHRAEKMAKANELKSTGADRNALAVIAKPRSGSEYSCRVRWSDGPALLRLKQWAADFDRGALPGGLPHELGAIWAECERVHSPKQATADFSRLWKARLVTVLKKKRLEDGEPLDADAQQALVEALCPAGQASRAALDQLLLARWLGADLGEVA